MNPVTSWIAASFGIVSAIAFIGALSTHLKVKRHHQQAPIPIDKLAQWRETVEKDRETRDNTLVAAVILAFFAVVLLVVAAVYR